MFIQNRLGLIEGTETMLAQSQRLNQISNNLANVDTPGYKKEDITFWEMLYKTNEDRQRVGKALKILTNQQEGSVKSTGNQFDFAISGDGFFKLQTPLGVRYSRAGNFNVNNEGQLVNPDGYLVLGDGGPIVIEGQNVAVGRDGTINVDGNEAGALDIATFNDLTGIEKEGTNLFRLKEGAAPEIPAADFTIRQGFLEASNVTLVTEMTTMLDLHRAYETQQKIIRTFDDIDGRAINTVGKLTG
ncbi:MAG: flagellar basal-body rod protein FlgF [Desulfobulbaceae bacterium]|nr:flagellar basal-body rod protein FlgF [Desulfobulbaceae bacterium]